MNAEKERYLKALEEEYRYRAIKRDLKCVEARILCDKKKRIDWWIALGTVLGVSLLLKSFS